MSRLVLQSARAHVLFVAYSPNGRGIAPPYPETRRPESGIPRLVLWEGHAGYVLTSRCRRNISGSGDQTIRNYNAETGSAVGKPPEGTPTIYSPSLIHPIGSRSFFPGSLDQRIRIWECRDWFCHQQTSRRAHRRCAVRCLHSRRAPHHLRILRREDSNLGSRHRFCGRRVGLRVPAETVYGCSGGV